MPIILDGASSTVSKASTPSSARAMFVVVFQPAGLQLRCQLCTLLEARLALLMVACVSLLLGHGLGPQLVSLNCPFVLGGGLFLLLLVLLFLLFLLPGCIF